MKQTESYFSNMLTTAYIQIVSWCILLQHAMLFDTILNGTRVDEAGTCFETFVGNEYCFAYCDIFNVSQNVDVSCTET